MADGEEIKVHEKKIPTFTVLKNGSILKNIVLFHKPPFFSPKELTVETSSNNQESKEEILVVGRHPHCNITLEHPSISRFHLRIHLNPSSHKISVVDLSSVHGTWVSENKIEPGVQVKLKEGDTVRMGGSRRIYELHWIPMSRAYDVDQFMLADMSKDGVEQTIQNENQQILEKFELLSSGGDSESLNLNPLSSSSPNCLNSFCDDAEVEHESPSRTSKENGEIFSTGFVPETETERLDLENENPPAVFVSEALSETKESDNQGSNWPAERSVTRDEDAHMIDDERLNHGAMEDDAVSGALFNANSKYENDSLTEVVVQNNDIDTGSDCEPRNLQKLETESVSASIFDGSFSNEKQALKQDLAKGSEFEEMNQKKVKNESASVALFNSKDGDEELSPSIIARDKEVSSGIKFELLNHDITKNKSGSLVLFDAIDRDEARAFTPETSRAKEIETTILEKTKNESMAIFDGLDRDEEGNFTLERENINPNSISSESLRNIGKNDECKQSNLCKMSLKKKAVRPTLFTNLDENKDVSREVLCSNSEKDNQTVRVKVKKSKVMKMEGSFCTSINDLQTIGTVCDPPHKSQEGLKKWLMVVDTNCLLHEESLKHLKILQGLRGTQLLIPQTVVKELMEMKEQNQNNFMKRKLNVSLALKWIEECMVNTRWWIHVEHSVDAPQLHSLETEVLEIALHLRRVITDRRIIILSDDLTLKIKSMAEGIMCETSEEFRKSLTNPFSERFMWVGRSARGHSWSCLDDVVLREKYYQCCPLNMPQRFKGLKLLVFNNSPIASIT